MVMGCAHRLLARLSARVAVRAVRLCIDLLAGQAGKEIVRIPRSQKKRGRWQGRGYIYYIIYIYIYIYIYTKCEGAADDTWI